MGNNRTGKRQHNGGRRRSGRLKFAALATFIVVGLGCMAMMYGFNVQTRDRGQWYNPEGSVEVAAPALTGGVVETLPRTTVTEIPTAVPTPEPTATPPSEPTATPERTRQPASITLTAAGDCTLGGQTRDGNAGFRAFDSYVQRYGYDYFFNRVRGIFASDDLTIVNLEGPLTDTAQLEAGHTYNFRGPTSYVNILSGSSVELCNVANNHSRDYGEQGFNDTVSALTGAGIASSGYSRVWYGEIKGVRVCSMGFTKWRNTPEEAVQAIRTARPNCDLLIVSMHWGEEGVYEATQEQVSLGHKAIDAGADVVIGTHPHVYGGIERYKGKYIVYSLGNFCFGGNTNPADKRCLIFQQTFNMDERGNITDGGINLIPCAVSSTKGKNDYQPMVMDADRGELLLENVQKVSAMSLWEADWMPGNYFETHKLTRLIARPAGVAAPVAEPTEKPLFG